MKLNTIEVLRIRLDEDPKGNYSRCMHIGISDIVMFRAIYDSEDNDFYITFMGPINDIRDDYNFEYLNCKDEKKVIKKCTGILIDFFSKFTKDKIEIGEINIENYVDKI